MKTIFNAQAAAPPVNNSQRTTRLDYQVVTLEDQYKMPRNKALFAGGIMAIFVSTATWFVLWIVEGISAFLAGITQIDELALTFPKIPLALGVFVVGGAYFVKAHFDEYESKAMWILERMTGSDLDDDTFVGDPEDGIKAPAEPQAAHIWVHHNANQATLETLPYTPEHMRIADGLLDGLTLSRRNWCPNNRGVDLSQGKFEIFQEAFVKAGFGIWKNENHHTLGVNLTSAGITWCETQTGRKASPPLLQKYGL